MTQLFLERLPTIAQLILASSRNTLDRERLAMQTGRQNP